MVYLTGGFSSGKTGTSRPFVLRPLSLVKWKQRQKTIRIEDFDTCTLGTKGHDVTTRRYRGSNPGPQDFFFFHLSLFLVFSFTENTFVTPFPYVHTFSLSSFYCDSTRVTPHTVFRTLNFWGYSTGPDNVFIVIGHVVLSNYFVNTEIILSFIHDYKTLFLIITSTPLLLDTEPHATCDVSSFCVPFFSFTTLSSNS